MDCWIAQYPWEKVCKEKYTEAAKIAKGSKSYFYTTEIELQYIEKKYALTLHVEY